MKSGPIAGCQLNMLTSSGSWLHAIHCWLVFPRLPLLRKFTPISVSRMSLLAVDLSTGSVSFHRRGTVGCDRLKIEKSAHKFLTMSNDQRRRSWRKREAAAALLASQHRSKRITCT